VNLSESLKDGDNAEGERELFGFNEFGDDDDEEKDDEEDDEADEERDSLNVSGELGVC
jgi:hypothetical protein